MCVASPGKITKIQGNEALVDYNGNIVRANIGIVDAKPGDCVLVHAGMVIQVLDPDEAEYMTELFRQLEELEN